MLDTLLANPVSQIFVGAFALLIIFSAIGAGLKWGIAKGKPHNVIDNMNSRTKAWWVMVGLLAVTFWQGRNAIIALFALISFQCLREYLSLIQTRRGDYRAMLWVFFCFLPLQYYLIWDDWYGLYSILIPVYGFLLLPISASLGKDVTQFLDRAAKIQWGLMICVYCLSHIPALLTLHIPGYPRPELLILFLLFVVQSSDVFQYVWGKLLGKHKLSPAISPSKTVEGLIGGVFTATLVGMSLWWATPFTPLQAALIALTINILGFFGGFVLSAIKRDRGVKDWGDLIEGHGGMLDRVDSLSFAAPVFFHIIRYWWV